MARENTARRRATASGGVDSADRGDDLHAVPAASAVPRERPDVVPASLDRLIHDRTRLAIMSALAVNESLGFVELRRLLRVTDGNLSVHARKLEEAGYVRCSKSFDGRVPKTEYRLAPAGRRALEQYLDHMEALINAARGR